VPHINSWEPRYFAKIPDGPQTCTLDALWLQEEVAQIHVSEGSQSFTFTKNVAEVSAPHLQHFAARKWNSKTYIGIAGRAVCINHSGVGPDNEAFQMGYGPRDCRSERAFWLH
jgi:hypothetical protein